MPISTSNASLSLSSLDKGECVMVADFTNKSVKGRDVVLINPIFNGGGDHVMANKIANIALDEGCRVTISAVDIKNFYQVNTRNLSLRDAEPHEMGALNNPVFVVAPVGILSIEKLNRHIDLLCEQNQFSKKDIVLIEEMDLSPSQKLAGYEAELRGSGFKNVSVNRLGFGEGSIGYLPTDSNTIDVIKQRFEGELLKLMDGYNMSLAKDSNYHLAYISSSLFVTGSEVFIANTLVETMGSEADSNFIMVLRQLSDYSVPRLTAGLRYILQKKTGECDISALFSEATVFFYNSHSGVLDRSIKIVGEGRKNVNIVVTGSLPNNIFEDFMCLAQSGMASGDQSLSEFLSMTGKMPYYDMQPWKYPLVQAIEKRGGEELKDVISQKVVGMMPFNGEKRYQFIPSLTQPHPSPDFFHKQNELDQSLSSNTATEAIKELFKLAGKNSE